MSKSNETRGGGENPDASTDWDTLARAEAEKSAREAGADPADVTDDDIAYQKKMMAMQERGDDFDPLSDEEMSKNETDTNINAKGQEYKRMPWNTWDMYARNGQSERMYHAQNAWNKRILGLIEDNPRDEGETTADYTARLRTLALHDIAQEQANDENRRLSRAEIRQVTKEYPRQEGEGTYEWATRIYQESGIDIGKFDKNADKPDFVEKATDDGGDTESETDSSAEDGGESEESEDDKKREARRKMMSDDSLENWRKKYGITDEDLKDDDKLKEAYDKYSDDINRFAREKTGLSDEELRNLSDEDIKKLIDDFDKSLETEDGEGGDDDGEKTDDSGEKSESEEDMEKLRQELIASILIPDLRVFLSNEGPTPDEVKDMSVEELKNLQEKLAERMREAFGAERLRDLLEDDDIKMEDLKDKNFDELKDQREKYRQMAIGEIGKEDYRDELEKRDIKAEDIRNMTLEELLDLLDSLKGKGPGDKEKKPDDGEEDPDDKDKEKDKGGKEKDDDDDDEDDPSRKEKKEKEKEPTEETDKWLIAVNQDVEADAWESAHSIAEKMLSEKKAKKGFIYRLIVGGMFRELAINAYRGKAYKLIVAKQKGESTSISDEDWSREAGFEKFVNAYVNNTERAVHKAAGEKMDTYGVDTIEEDGKKREVVKRYWTDESGVKHEEVIDQDSPQAEATKDLRDAIAAYAKDGDKKAFESRVIGIQDVLREAGGNPNTLMSENYIAVAEAARDRAEHGQAIQDVMSGFRFINAEARNNVRTKAHRDALDRMTNRLMASRIGSCFPPEIVSTVAATAVYFSRSGIRNALVAAGSVVVGATMAPAVVPLAVGMGMAGTMAAIRERNRVTGDRAENARAVATGGDVNSPVIPANATRRQKRYIEKQRKYGEKMAETQYDTVDAGFATEKLKAAMASGNMDEVVKAYSEFDTMVKMSDSGAIDLISYSSPNAKIVSDERLALDTELDRAEKMINAAGIKDVKLKMADAASEAKERLENDISAKDKAFRKLRRRRMAGNGLKSAVVAGVFQIGTQEAIAFADKGKVGLVESAANDFAKTHFGHELTQNAPNAENTFLAGLVGLDQSSTAEHVLYQGAELSDDQVKRLEADPNTTVIRGADKVTTGERHVSLDEALEAQGATKATLVGSYPNKIGKIDGTEFGGMFRKHTTPDGDTAVTWFTEPKTKIYPDGIAYNGDRMLSLSGLTEDKFGFVIEPVKGGQQYFVPSKFVDGAFVADYSGQPELIKQMAQNREMWRMYGVEVRGVSANGTIEAANIWGTKNPNPAPDGWDIPVETRTPTYDVVQHITSNNERAVADMPILPGVVSRIDLAPLGRKKKQEKANTIEDNPVPPVPPDNPTPKRVNTIEDNPVPPVPPDEPTPIGVKTISDNPPGPVPKPVQKPKVYRIETTKQPVPNPDQKPQTGSIDADPSQKPDTEPNAPQGPASGEKNENRSNDNIIRNLDRDQIRALKPNETMADGEVTRVEYEIEQWNALPSEQKAAILKGDYRGFGVDAVSRRAGINILREMGLLPAEPSTVAMPESATKPSGDDLGDFFEAA